MDIRRLITANRRTGLVSGLLRLHSIAIPLVAFQAVLMASAQPSPAYEQTVLRIQKEIEGGNLDQARRLIEAVESKYPRDGGLENLLGVIEIQEGHTAEASRDFTDAITRNPRLVGAYLNLGRIEMQTAGSDPKMRASALRHSLKVVELDPGNDEAHYQLASLYLWDKRYQLSLNQLEKLNAAARKQVGAEALFCVDRAVLGPRIETSIAATALASNPDLTEDDASTCLPSLQAARRADLIEELFAAVMNHQQLSAKGMRILGLAQEADGKLHDARATLENGFAASNNSVVILEDLARVARTENDSDGALGYLAHARDLAPNDPKLPYAFAAVCLRLRLFGEARKALDDALHLAPDNPDYNLAMGLVVSYSADPSQALPYIKRYLELRPGDPEGPLAMGTANFRAKDYDAATQWLKRARENPKTAADAHFYLGRIALLEGHLDEAMMELRKSLFLHPGQADTLSALGQVSLLEHDFKQASARFEEALRLEPDNYTANFGLLQLYARTGDPRREKQSQRFDEIKNQKEEQDRQMMRTIQIRRDDESDPQNRSASEPFHRQQLTPHGEPR
ncbi:MAG TPA: tetratricopeptide repeat protein [Terracidiphilus sp.]